MEYNRRETIAIEYRSMSAAIITENELNVGYSADGSSCGPSSQGDTPNDLHRNVLGGVDCYFGDGTDRLRAIPVHVVRDEVIVA